MKIAKALHNLFISCGEEIALMFPLSGLLLQMLLCWTVAVCIHCYLVVQEPNKDLDLFVSESSPQTAGNFLTFCHSYLLFCRLLKKLLQREHFGCDVELRTKMPWLAQTLYPYVFSLEIIHRVFHWGSRI